MNQNEIKELIHLIDQSSLKYFELENASVSLKLSKRDADHVVNTNNNSTEEQVNLPNNTSTTSSVTSQDFETTEIDSVASDEVSADDETLHVIKSPIVGTSYRSSSPDSPAFVKVGDTVDEGQTVLIIEAMKVMNEIKSDVSGVIEEVLVDDGQAIEFDQALIKIKVN